MYVSMFPASGWISSTERERLMYFSLLVFTYEKAIVYSIDFKFQSCDDKF